MISQRTFRDYWLGPLGVDGTGYLYGLTRNYRKPNAYEMHFYVLDDYYRRTIITARIIFNSYFNIVKSAHLHKLNISIMFTISTYFNNDIIEV